MTKEKWTVNRASDIINNEEIGYAVMYYCHGSDFNDKKLAKLWDDAAKALKKLEEYIEENRSDDGEEEYDDE